MIDGFIIRTKKLEPREVKKKLRNFIDEISDGCSPELELMAEELKRYGDTFVDAISGIAPPAQFRNDGQGFRNAGGFSHSSFRGQQSGGGGMQQRGEFRDDVQMRGGGAQMRDDIDWNEKERQRQRENMQKLDDLEAEIQRVKMRMSQGSY